MKNLIALLVLWTSCGCAVSQELEAPAGGARGSSEPPEIVVTLGAGSSAREVETLLAANGSMPVRVLEETVDGWVSVRPHTARYLFHPWRLPYETNRFMCKEFGRDCDACFARGPGRTLCILPP